MSGDGVAVGHELVRVLHLAIEILECGRHDLDVVLVGDRVVGICKQQTTTWASPFV